MPKISVVSVKDMRDVKLIEFVALFKSVLIAFVVTLVLLVVLALLMTYTSISESYIFMGVLVSTVISNIVGGALTARKARSSGWLNGALAGVVYMVILFLLGMVIRDSAVNVSNALGMFATGFFSGAFGGIIGINLNANKRR